MSNNNDNADGKDVDEYAAPPKHESKRILVANLCLLPDQEYEDLKPVSVQNVSPLLSEVACNYLL